MQFQYLPYESNFLKSINEIKKILIIVAMDSERDALTRGQSFKSVTLGKKLKCSLDIMKLARCEILISKSGVGLVNTGVAISKILENYDIDAIIQLGVGGALDERLDVGDVVISKRVIQYDSITTQEDGNLLMAPGELTLSRPFDQQIDPVMRTDAILREWIKEALSKDKTRKMFEGTILSGSEFVGSLKRKQSLRNLYDEALLVEMEACAIAQIARKLEIPFVSAKTVADRASPKQSISDDYKNSLDAANSHSRMILDSLLETF